MAGDKRSTRRHEDKAGKGENGNDLLPGIDSEFPHQFLPQDPNGYPSNSEAEWRADAEQLGTNALARKYPKANSAFRAMKIREREGRAEIDPEFATFKSFFSHMGPPPRPGDTLDRIDNDNHRYGPGLNRWASKEEQARNRSTTIFVTDEDTGEKFPLAQIAADIGAP
jgi:hypothetical protein